jgi:adenylate kinase
VEKLRALELKKAPSITETLDWARALALLNADTLSAELLAATLNVVLKHESDVEKARASLAAVAAAAEPD